MRHSITETGELRYVSGDPLLHYEQWSRESRLNQRLLLVDFDLQQYWLPGKGSLALTAIYYTDELARVSVSVTDQALEITCSSLAQQYGAWGQQHGFAQSVLGEALSLQPTHIAKPWGQEIWFTGVEERGVCTVKQGAGETPLPWLQSVMPQEQIGQRGEPLILLKILDPVAEPVIGDLYFELHEEKREVYVVTHIDPGAWPSGTGYIRFGFSATKRSQYRDDGEFRSAYLLAVHAYEQVRRQIDESQAAPCTLSPEIIARERELRGEMDSYTGMKPLAVGDVVKVPLLTPHSLQHGVRTIEFQTPVYERKILSFGQKVVTQNHWDTAEAVAQMQIAEPPVDPLEVLSSEEGVLIERIVDFSDFEVQRIQLESGRSLANLNIEQYALAMVVEGNLALDGAVYHPEQSLLLPRGWRGTLASSQPTETLILLLAYPCKRAVES